MSEILLRCVCEPLCKCLFDKFEVQHSSTAAVRRSVYVPKDMYPNTVRIKISNDKDTIRNEKILLTIIYLNIEPIESTCCLCLFISFSSFCL